MPNRTLELAAIAAVEDDAFETKPSYCQRFVRQVIQSEYGGRFDKFHKDTADASMKAWAKSPYAVHPDRGSVPGDILYWRETPSRRHGHVGVRVTGNKIAENSYVHQGNQNGAKGYRPLSALGKPDLIVRIPEKQ